MISPTEENYLKAIFKICEKSDKAASTNAVSAELDTKAASVTDMLKRLAEKGLINYAKYRGVTLTGEGLILATQLIRKHRLWEVFLLEKLDFSWDEVHEIAEQLEHIQSKELVERLDNFLGNPKHDPHGDPIPDADGKFTYRKQILLSELRVGEEGVVVGVNEHSSPFLKYLDQMELVLGAKVKMIERFEYDESSKLFLNNEKEVLVSAKVSQHIFVQQKD